VQARFKGIVHPKTLSLITHPHVIPNPEDFRSFLEHNFFIKSECFLPLYRQLKIDKNIDQPKLLGTREQTSLVIAEVLHNTRMNLIGSHVSNNV